MVDVDERPVGDDADLEAYRERARQWLAANLKRRSGGAVRGAGGGDDQAPERVAAQRALQATLHAAGYAGITWPVEYGGQGLTLAHQRVFSEEAAGYQLPMPGGVAGGVTFRIVAPTIMAHGTEAQKRDWLPKILRGEEIWVQFLSEPSAGSDLAGIRTRAERDGDHWVLNGAKIWSSGAAAADAGICLARTNWDVPKHRGLTWFRVPLDAPGVTVRPIREINGGAEFCEEFFDDVIIPDEYVIGEVDNGWSVANTLLAHERGGESDSPAGPPAVVPGVLPADLVALARRRGTTGDPTARQLIARAHINDFVHSYLIKRVISGMRDQKMPVTYASYIKLDSGICSPTRAAIGMELAGTDAVAWDPEEPEGAVTSTNYLNGRIISIAGGSDQVQRNIISERILGLPREPSYDADKPFNEVLAAAERWGTAGAAPPTASR